ncbi:hypothetical protein ORV05_15600 [Amycolatopsis cynarae]|uniref:Uncharacterized protein n=1 Tax=Amycolatopsis cynarae TaxID=2995223 RepID=A0ABY7BAE6_9PSEU|nr:hypothetical protein [Amycolatopsis sp. HUAS 11-8]WAL69126.1 hypothetical protein ORV05_15600 [Amycolatopsis sp. HUAS 11-8]
MDPQVVLFVVRGWPSCRRVVLPDAGTAGSVRGRPFWWAVAGAFVGLSIGGRISDQRPHLALLTGASAIVILSVVMVIAIREAWVVVPTMFLIGVAAFVLNPARAR